MNTHMLCRAFCAFGVWRGGEEEGVLVCASDLGKNKRKKGAHLLHTGNRKSHLTACLPINTHSPRVPHAHIQRHTHTHKTKSTMAGNGHALHPVSGPKENVGGLLDNNIYPSRFAELDQVCGERAAGRGRGVVEGGGLSLPGLLSRARRGGPGALGGRRAGRSVGREKKVYALESG